MTSPALGAVAPAGTLGPTRPLRRFLDWRWAPVAFSAALAAVLQVVWLGGLATTGGDIAAQDAWAEFARLHPNSAYDLAWYGGMHPVSYSVLSPYVMALLGVRTTMVVASILAATCLSLLLMRQRATGWRRFVAPGLAAVGFFGNAVSGRVTFALGTAVAIAAVAALPSPGVPARGGRARFVTAAVLAAIATACSPVAGLFLGVFAAALWLTGRRRDSLIMGLPPVAVVVASALLFPFSGQEPMSWNSAILPGVAGISCVVLAPPAWRLLRVAGAVYVAAVLFAWLVPSPIGTNISRLGLVAGVIVLAAVWVERSTHGWGGRRGLLVCGLASALLTTGIWQVAVAAQDAVHGRPPTSWMTHTQPLVAQLQERHAGLGRVEVVPSRNHSEQTALADYVPLARGWNRQADVERNPLFYDHRVLSADAYRAWLDRWAVDYVVLPATLPDPAGGIAEARLVSSRPSYLHEVWSDEDWTLFAVERPTSLVSAPATIRSFTSARVVIDVPHAGTYVVRVAHSPWLTLVRADGAPIPASSTPALGASCLSDLDTDDPLTEGKHVDDWVVLHATSAGIFRIAAPYHLPRGSACAS